MMHRYYLRKKVSRHFRTNLRAITPLQLRGKGIEIHGCNAAEGGSGIRFVESTARIVALPVTASPNIRYADNLFRFE